MSKLSVKIYHNIMSANEEWALKTRRLVAEKKVRLWNLIGSPGSGKTALLERLCPLLDTYGRVAVLEGDVETAHDAERLAALGIQAHQIVTGGACHLGAEVIYKALVELELNEIGTVFVENVGNLVCPSEFDIGEMGKIAAVSVTEGEDKPLKYPKLFREAKAAVITKTDLLPHLQVNVDHYRDNIRQVNPDIPVFIT
ncbi:MAG TPA: hydrogenase accessory protein HypB, partial [Spirochaetia bacterium]|nr:hydrogenase accessory protein HypB [Spirochaetia bacterium]